MMGGELFQDGQDPDLYNQYFDLCDDVTKHAKSIGKEVRFTLVTNMIWQDRDSVEKFVNRLASADVSYGFSTSFDFHGRPVKYNPQEVWYANVTYFRDKIDTVNMVLTRPSIQKFLNGDNTFFKQIYDEGFPLSFDYYTPETNAFLLVPSDKEVLDALLKIAREFPNISPMRYWIDNEFNSMTCMGPNKITILPSGRIVTCRQLKYNPGDFMNDVFYESNANLILNAVTKKECLTCPFFARCGFSCFVMEDHKYFAQRKELPECLYKIMFKEIDNGLNHQTD
jgi:radical SAM protein with 4Fe4S-binding SPASM domain